MSKRWEHLTQDDVPGRRTASRPRTKQRPAHADAQEAVVIGVDRGRYLARMASGGKRDVMAVKARELGHRGVVVGDQAFLTGDVSGRKDALARIVRVGPRRTELRRATDEGRGRERVVVANADQMVIVAALANPEPRIGMIDRQLVAAYDAGLDVILCLTKADLGADGALRALYEPLGVTVATTGRFAAGGTGETDGGDGIGGGMEGLDRVRELLTGRVSVLVGHSGVGKSTLINALVPGARRATGEVNLVTGKGRHTSSSAVALELPGGGWVVDTPGVRSFGLSHVHPERVLAAFPDLAARAAECPRGCPHGPDQPECALAEWALGSAERKARFASYLRIVASSGEEN
ncbi:MAG: ribosome small subunit-dependent GTPase A [Bifidobacteriaceae bacterium]|nr:ribosome small subunit-dependent GTPase A [Bifidobacteriaceae bacterium]